MSTRSTAAASLRTTSVVITNRDGRAVTVAPGQTVLEAAEADGLILPYGCRYGGCVTCAARLVSGVVEQSEAVGLKDYMRQAGYVLTCVAYPITDCELEVGVESHKAGLYRNPFRNASALYTSGLNAARLHAKRPASDAPSKQSDEINALSKQ